MEQIEQKNTEGKQRFTLWIKDSTRELIDSTSKLDCCNTISEFIEKAILFYCGYVTHNKNPNYLPNIVVSTLKSIIRDSDNQQNKMLFKLCVEISLMMNVLATTKGIKRESLEQLRQLCEEEVRKTNGTISIWKALEWQE